MHALPRGTGKRLIHNRVVERALAVLGVERLVLGVHDLMLPSLPEEDTGRGSPLSRGARELVDFSLGLGFNALQLGPQGQTSGDNPSPYDGAIFSRNPAALSLLPLTEPEQGELLTLEDVRGLVSAGPTGKDRADHQGAERIAARALRLAYDRFVLQDTPVRRELARGLAGFRAQASDWLERDGLFEVLAAEHLGADPRGWPAGDQELFGSTAQAAGVERRRELAERQAAFLERRAFAQFLLHAQHAAFQRSLRERGATLYGDLQIGLSSRDAWGWRRLFLKGLVMGAPPSRTTPLGQPWGYPVLDPVLFSAAAPGLAFVRLRIEKMLREYDGFRIDHPHGWVCPWVYDAVEAGSAASVERGTRLFESPDDPRCARFAIARLDQLRLELPRFDDAWVRELDEPQVDRYAVLTDEILACADRLGRSRELLLWELLSTQPHPLERVLRRQGLGRFRVTQKVRLGDPADGYRSEHANPGDWIMVGNHDTEPIWAVARRWQESGELAARASYLAGRLRPEASARARFAARLESDPLLIAQAQFADLFASRAKNVLVFVSDLLGETRWFNIPGVVDPDNWTLRVPGDFRRVYRERLESSAALDLPLALTLALKAKGYAATHAELIRELRLLANPETVARLG